MSHTIFENAFGKISHEVRRDYVISDEELFGMVSPDFYKSLNNPEVNGPKSMLKSLAKEQGQVVEETPEEIAIREAMEREQRILAHIKRVEIELQCCED